MTHEPHKARRIQRSAVSRALLKKLAPVRKDLLLGALVGGSMLLITGLYAATLRFQKVFNQPADFPRWTSLADGLIARSKPIQGQMGKVKDAFVILAKAKRTQSATADVLKKKISERKTAPATATPETP
jgi:hypothetical protein